MLPLSTDLTGTDTMNVRSSYQQGEADISLTASSPPTSSSSRPSISSQPSSSSSRSNLPPPPPPGRVPPPKGRSLRNAGQKLRIGKRTEKRRADEGEEEEWTLEDGYQVSEEGGMEELMAMDDSQTTERPYLVKKGDRESKGKRLAHKTSQLFSRKDKGRTNDDSNLSAPSASRQTSYSSTASSESSRSNPLPLVQSRQSVVVSAAPKPKPQHTRRISQDSQTLWHGVQRTTRSGSSSTESPPESAHLPIPRRQSSNLSASVPSLSRNHLPQPSLAPSSMSTRMSSWFTHLISSSTSPETVMAASADPPSPARKSTSAAANFLNAARQRAVDGVRHLLDTEAQPDKSTDTMWLMGLPHPGYQPGSPSRSPSIQSPDLPDLAERDSASSGRPSPPSKIESLRPAGWPKRKDSGPMSPPNKSLGQLLTGSAISLNSPQKDSDSPGRRRAAGKDTQVQKWPEAFYDDFRTRIWCTYRGQYAPILPMPTGLLIPSPEAYYAAFATKPVEAPPPASENSMATKPSSWGWPKAPEERGLTSDAGWGCMLRTGQSLLANALINLHLGRDWRLPEIKPQLDPTTPSSVLEVEAYATYVRILSYFMDDPSPLCPFSVHRMALIGKELGKEVGEWFGPSTASGALKTLADAFPPCGLAVSTASDGIIYKSDVYAASSQLSGDWKVAEDERVATGRWGGKAVLLLIGLRLGLDGVNPIYHDSIKALFTFPQSVGIAGGRPNTSYYFVASQGNNLFYLDPHFTRPAVPLEIPPAGIDESRRFVESNAGKEADIVSQSRVQLDLVDADDVSDNSDDSLPPSQKRRNRAERVKRISTSRASPSKPSSAFLIPSSPTTPIASSSSRPIDVFDAPTPPASFLNRDSVFPQLDPQTAWYLNAYTETQLHTFHSEKVRKMPLSGLDPSMLLGFLVRDEADFEDFCRRAHDLPQKIFSVQDEPPTWDEDDAGLESVSEPEFSDGDGHVPVPVHSGTNKVLLADTASLGLEDRGIPIQQKPKVTGEEDDWEAPSSYPVPLGIIDRSATPNSIPVLVERPSLDMPKNAPSSSNGDHREARGAEAEEEGVGEEEDVVEDTGTAKRVAPGVRVMMRQRTDSWVKPDRPDDF